MQKAIDVDKEEKVVRNLDKMMAHLMKGQPMYMILKNKAVLLGEKGLVDASLEAYEQALKAHTEDKMRTLNPLFPVVVLQEMGQMLVSNGRFEDALERFEQGAISASGLPPSADRTSLVHALQLALLQMLRHLRNENALTRHEELLARARIESKAAEAPAEEGETPLESLNTVRAREGDFLYALAELLNSRKQYAKAAPVAREALAVREAIFGRERGCGPIILALSLVAAIISAPDIGLRAEAEEFAGRALGMARSSDTPFTQQTKAQELGSLANLLRSIQQARQRSGNKKTT